MKQQNLLKSVVLLGAIVIIGLVGYLWYRDVSGWSDPGEVELVTYVDRGLDPEVKTEFESKVVELEAKIAEDPNANGVIATMQQLGIYEYNLGDLAAAKHWFEEILARNDRDDAAHENLANTLIDMGDYAGAEAHIRAALAINTTYEKLYLDLVDLIAERFPERQAEIGPILEGAIATMGQTPNLVIRLGDWYLANERYEEAISHYKVAQQLLPDDESIDDLIDAARKAQNP